MTSLNESQAGIKIVRRNISNVRYADNTTLMAKSEEKLKNLLMKLKESVKCHLKLNIQKMMIMASSPTTSWQIDGETMERVTDFIFRGSNTTEDGDCNDEIKKTLVSWKKSYDKQDIEKQRHHFANKVLSSQSYGFSSSHVRIES